MVPAKCVPHIQTSVGPERKKTTVVITARNLEQFSESYSSPSAFPTQLASVPAGVMKVWATII